MHLVDAPLSLDALLAETERDDCGALAVFSGTVRNHHGGKTVTRLVYTAYAPVATRVLREIETEVVAKFDVAVCRIAHRVGDIPIGESAVMVVVRGAHRGPAFDAVRYGIDEVKQRVPVWKEEFYADGTRVYVEGCAL